MGRTTITIVSGMAALAVAAGCSSSSGSASAGARDAAVTDVQNTATVDGESEASVGVGEEGDASVNNSSACVSAGGACMGVLTCTVVGPVHCGPNSLCCQVMTTVTDAAGSSPANGCGTSNCSDAATSSSAEAAASPSADAAAE